MIYKVTSEIRKIVNQCQNKKKGEKALHLVKVKKKSNQFFFGKRVTMLSKE